MRNHFLWLSHYRSHLHDRRATAVFVCASQAHAGDFLTARDRDADPCRYRHNTRTRCAASSSAALPSLSAPLPRPATTPLATHSRTLATTPAGTTYQGELDGFTTPSAPRGALG
eukprot:7113157-Prymnesium_polylepis.1